jgi:hypothetical protein
LDETVEPLAEELGHEGIACPHDHATITQGQGLRLPEEGVKTGTGYLELELPKGRLPELL